MRYKVGKESNTLLLMVHNFFQNLSPHVIQVLTMSHKHDFNKILYVRTFLTPNLDPGRYLSFRRSATTTKLYENLKLSM